MASGACGMLSRMPAPTEAHAGPPPPRAGRLRPRHDRPDPRRGADLPRRLQRRRRRPSLPPHDPRSRRRHDLPPRLHAPRARGRRSAPAPRSASWPRSSTASSMARSAFNHSMNYRSVVVFGTAREVTDEDELHTAAAAITSHVAPGREDEARMPTRRRVPTDAPPRGPARGGLRQGPHRTAEGRRRRTTTLPIWAGVLPLVTSAGRPRARPDLARRHRRASLRLRVPPTRHAVSSAPEPSPRLRDSYRALPRTVWILFAGTFVLRLASFVFPFLALYLTQPGGLSVQEAGLAITGYGIGAMRRAADRRPAHRPDRATQRDRHLDDHVLRPRSAPPPGAVAPLGAWRS